MEETKNASCTRGARLEKECRMRSQGHGCAGHGQAATAGVQALLFHTLSGLVIAFLPRSKCLLISWLQSLSAIILESKKIKSVTLPTFFPFYLPSSGLGVPHGGLISGLSPLLAAKCPADPPAQEKKPKGSKAGASGAAAPDPDPDQQPPQGPLHLVAGAAISRS